MSFGNTGWQALLLLSPNDWRARKHSVVPLPAMLGAPARNLIAANMNRATYYELYRQARLGNLGACAMHCDRQQWLTGKPARLELLRQCRAELDLVLSPVGPAYLASLVCDLSQAEVVVWLTEQLANLSTLIQIERSGSGQTAYCPTPKQSGLTLADVSNAGQLTERPDLLDCVAGCGKISRVIQVRYGGDYSGTTGMFFALQ